MKLKRFAAAALAFCLMLTLLPGGVSAEPVTLEDGSTLENGVLTVYKDVLTTSGASWSEQAEAITRVEIGPDVAIVSGKAFEKCVNLRSFTVAPENTVFSTGDGGVLYSFKKDEIVCYPPALSSSYLGKDHRYMVPESVVKVCRYAFSGLIYNKDNNPLEIYALEKTLTSVAFYCNNGTGHDFPEGMIHPYVPVTGISLDTGALPLEVGETKTLRATVLPEDATFPEVLWSLEPEEFAEVVGTATEGTVTEGTVTGVSAGTARVTAAAADGGGKHTASCIVTVVKKDVDGLALTPEELTLDKGGSDTLTARLRPANATDRLISFLSTDTSVVTVSSDDPGRKTDPATGAVTIKADGEDAETALAGITVTAVDPGTASIIAATSDGDHFAICKVTVRPTEITKFELDKSELELTRGPDGGNREFTLTARVEPEEATYGTVSWYSSDKNVVEVKEVGGNGNRTATLTTTGPGKAAVVARTEDGQQLSCAVTVWDAPAEAGVSMTGLTLAPGESWDHLYAVILPATAEQGVTWESSDDSVAKVDKETGVVTAVADGVAIITATSKADENIKAKCRVTVQTSVTGLTLKKDGEAVGSLTLNESGNNTSATLTAVLTPGGATEKGVTFLSTAPDVVKIDDTDKIAVKDDGQDSASASVTVTAGSPGTATIIATAKDGNHAAICTVTVNATKVTGVTLDQSALTLGLNDTATLTAAVAPESALEKGVRFDIAGSTDVIELTDNGDGTAAVKPKSAGTATVKVTTNEDGKTAECTVTVVPTAVKSVRISDKSLALKLGGTTEETLSVEITPSDSTDPTVKWASSDAGVANVDETSGTVTAVSVGTALITATVTDALGQEYTASCAVTVSPMRVTNIELDQKTLSFQNSGDIESLTAALTPGNATDQTITFFSTDPDVAKLDFVGTGKKSETGAVTVEASGGGATVNVEAGNPGTASIIAVTADGGFTARCTVTVYQPVMTVRIQQGTDVKLNKNDTAALEAIIMPDNAPQTVTWSSDKPEIATVDGETGAVKALASGTATITATAADGQSASCTVTVRVPVESVTLDKTSLTVDLESEMAGSLSLEPNIQPADATDTKVRWFSSDPSVADVGSESGRITPKKAGIAAIIAVTDDGGKTASCTVTVRNAVASVTLDKTSLTLMEGTKAVLIATVEPSGRADQGVTWESSDDSVATVMNGEVAAVKEGTATITARSRANPDVYVECDVTVTKAVVSVNSVKLNKDSLTLQKGKSETLTLTFDPTNADNKEVEWKSTNGDVATVSGGAVTAISPGSATIIATAKDGGHMDWCTVTVQPVVESLTLNTTEMSIGLKDRELRTLTATADPYDAIDQKEIQFTVSDETVLKLAGSGNIRTVIPLKEGTATVTVTAGEETAICSVSVSGGEQNYAEIAEKSLSLTMGGEPKSLTVTVKKSGAGVDISGFKTVWSSSDAGVAKVDETSGTVTAVSVGTALITATVTDGDTGQIYTASCAVTVKPKPVVSVTGATQKPFITLSVSDTITLNVTISPAEATNKNVRWYSSDEDVAEVSAQGEVKAKAPGTAVIVATTEDGGFTTTCTVTVTGADAGTAGLALDRTALSLVYIEDRPESERLIATVPEAHATVTWSSSDESVAKVDADGLVTAAGKGMATITAAVTYENGKTITAVCFVTVRAAVTGLTLLPEIVTLELDGEDNSTAALTATVTPGDASDTGVSWYSSNPAIATVDAYGLVTAISPGTAVIIAATADGAAASCTVTVTGQVVSVPGIDIAGGETPLALSLNRDSLVLTADGESLLTANQAVTWTGSDGNVATVEDGLVKAVSAGTAVITATAASGATATCTVTVTGYTLSIETVEAPVMTVSDNTGGSKTVTLTAAGRGEILYALDNNAEFEKYDGTPIEVTKNTMIKAYAVSGGQQSATITGYIFIGDGGNSPIVTDSMGNTVGSAAEALAVGSVMANVTLTAEAAAEAPDLYLAVYDTQGALIALEKYEAKLNGSGGQVISQVFDLDIPAEREVGLIRLMVLSKDKTPLMGAGTLSG